MTTLSLLCSIFVFSILMWPGDAWISQRSPQTYAWGKALSLAMNTKVGDLKGKIRSIGAKTTQGLLASEEDHLQARSVVDEIAGLASLPLDSKGFGDLMNGPWDLTYTTNREFSSGKAGPFIGKVLQRIDGANTVYYNDLSLFNNIVSATLKGTWEEEGVANKKERMWKIVFLEVTLRLFGLPVKTQSMLGNVGLWRTIYLDDDMRIFFARNYNNLDAKENLYVLSRAKK